MMPLKIVWPESWKAKRGGRIIWNLGQSQPTDSLACCSHSFTSIARQTLLCWYHIKQHGWYDYTDVDDFEKCSTCSTLFLSVNYLICLSFCTETKLAELHAFKGVRPWMSTRSFAGSVPRNNTLSQCSRSLGCLRRALLTDRTALLVEVGPQHPPRWPKLRTPLYCMLG